MHDKTKVLTSPELENDAAARVSGNNAEGVYNQRTLYIDGACVSVGTLGGDAYELENLGSGPITRGCRSAALRLRGLRGMQR